MVAAASADVSLNQFVEAHKEFRQRVKEYRLQLLNGGGDRSPLELSFQRLRGHAIGALQAEPTVRVVLAEAVNAMRDCRRGIATGRDLAEPVFEDARRAESDVWDCFFRLIQLTVELDDYLATHDELGTYDAVKRQLRVNSPLSQTCREASEQIASLVALQSRVHAKSLPGLAREIARFSDQLRKLAGSFVIVRRDTLERLRAEAARA